MVRFSSHYFSPFVFNIHSTPARRTSGRSLENFKQSDILSSHKIKVTFTFPSSLSFL